VSVFWHFLQIWTGWQCSLKMCPGCESFPAYLDWLTVLSEYVSRVWVWPGISCQSGLADSALWKCVQAVSVFWHFLQIWTDWQCSLKMCPGCECVLAFSVKLDWLTVLSENVSSLWVCSGIFCQTELADSTLLKTNQDVSVFWQFLSHWQWLTNSILINTLFRWCVLLVQYYKSLYLTQIFHSNLLNK